MVNEPGNARRELSQDLLRVFEQALGQRELAAAEHVLCALEELARADADCQAALDRAYLQIAAGALRAAPTSRSK